MKNYYLFIIITTISLATGCKIISRRPTQQQLDTKLQNWQTAKQNYQYNKPKIHFATVNVTKFGWFYCNLDDWQHSGILIKKILKQYYKLDDKKFSAIVNPNKKQLENFFIQLAKKIKPDETLILYLGTHHIKGNKIFLYNKQYITAQQLFDILKPIKQPITLVADTCYAERLQYDAKIPPNITCIFAGKINEKTPNLPLDGSKIGPFHYFFAEQYILQKELKIKKNNYSLAGYIFASTLLKMVEKNYPITDSPKLGQTYLELYQNFRNKLTLYPTPHPVILLGKKNEL